jgi:hypothetical protein
MFPRAPGRLPAVSRLPPARRRCRTRHRLPGYHTWLPPLLRPHPQSSAAFPGGPEQADVRVVALITQGRGLVTAVQGCVLKRRGFCGEISPVWVSEGGLRHRNTESFPESGIHAVHATPLHTRQASSSSQFSSLCRPSYAGIPGAARLATAAAGPAAVLVASSSWILSGAGISPPERPICLSSRIASS